MFNSKNIKKIFKQCGYDPEQIGIILLKQYGYKIDKAIYCYDNSIYVKDKKDKMLYWR